MFLVEVFWVLLCGVWWLELLLLDIGLQIIVDVGFMLVIVTIVGLIWFVGLADAFQLLFEFGVYFVFCLLLILWFVLL